MSLGAP